MIKRILIIISSFLLFLMFGISVFAIPENIPEMKFKCNNQYNSGFYTWNGLPWCYILTYSNSGDSYKMFMITNAQSNIDESNVYMTSDGIGYRLLNQSHIDSIAKCYFITEWKEIQSDTEIRNFETFINYNPIDFSQSPDVFFADLEIIASTHDIRDIDGGSLLFQGSKSAFMNFFTVGFQPEIYGFGVEPSLTTAITTITTTTTETTLETEIGFVSSLLPDTSESTTITTTVTADENAPNYLETISKRLEYIGGMMFAIITFIIAFLVIKVIGRIL